jgi:CSLREA domain-containing protein
MKTMTSTQTTMTKTNHFHHYFRALVALAVLAMMAVMLLAANRPAHAESTFTVDSQVDASDINLDDDVCDVNFGPDVEECTLRAAIQEANNTPGADVINFNINTLDRIATISPVSQLPEITDRVTIDGYSQPGASPNKLAKGTNAVLKIELEGSRAGTASGLQIDAGGSGSVVKGLAINRFTLDGIAIVRNNSNSLGNNQNTIEGNFIGTDLGGTFDVGNGGDGVSVSSPSSSNTVGGSSPAARNLISGNGGEGVNIKANFLNPGPASFNRVMGNLIGTKKDGTTALGNSDDGVEIFFASNNTVSSNTIAFNFRDGVRVFETFGPDAANGNLLFGNSIFSNVEQGIDLGDDGRTINDPDDPATPEPDPDSDTGPNGLQNFPVLTSAKTSPNGTTTIKGTLNSQLNRTFILQFFSNPKGNEGKKLIGQAGVSTDATGNATFTFKPAQKVRIGKKITATATDAGAKNTSEFSAPKKVVAS